MIHRIGSVTDSTTRQLLPLYALRSFLDTPEGWQLYRTCRVNGNMRPYEAAKAAWKEANNRVEHRYA